MSEPNPGWLGYMRPDGRKGIRNLVLVIYTVECAQFVAQAVAQDEENVQVIGFPGCFDNQFAVRLMLALARHPNVGAVLAVGLGCEYTQPGMIAEVVRKSGRPAESFFVQEAGGTVRSIKKGKAIVARLRRQIRAEAQRAPMSLSDLTVACKCGGSDATSGLAGNPVVGAFFDRLTDAGGRAVIEEITEMIGLREILTARAANDGVRAALAAA
ncbi:MAG: UxaA family hydrolase, partial [Verrucomicrobia bacterium]|nr:UxaA family hydrolase [Verrucomicrobiota bacterium]